MISDFEGEPMNITRFFIEMAAYLDDIFFALALISFVVASYLVCPVLGTYVLGGALLAAACWAGKWLQSPVAKAILMKIRRKG